jgi:hypothetical protein
MDSTLLKSLIAVSAITLAACSSQPTNTSAATPDAGVAAKQVPAGPPEPVPAKTAYWEIYKPAHAWAADLLPLGVKSGEVAGVKNADGKAGVWTVVFASPSKRQQRTYTYSVADQLPDISKGVREGFPEPWAGPTKDVMVFQSSDFSVDSDAAYKTAASKAETWLKEKDNAEKPVSMNLGAAQRFPAPVWAVTFGSSKSGYLALVNATNGEIMTK